MTKYRVEVLPEELKKKNCLTCEYGEYNTGIACYDSNRER